ncbi:hypothetical protein ACH6EH_10430 [Paenibacillus sp. JSM ZJ436]|uniref:hypothetical protein n=1 Tax=Paenibacillus sp. JSM ZJ436 TaxID=3376190 RepID=UPI0037A0F8BF
MTEQTDLNHIIRRMDEATCDRLLIHMSEHLRLVREAAEPTTTPERKKQIDKEIEGIRQVRNHIILEYGRKVNL